MELSNKEKKQLFDAAIAMGKAMTTMVMAKERLVAMSNLSTRLLSIKMDEATIAVATARFEEDYGNALERFLQAMGVKDDNDPFRKYLEEEQKAVAEAAAAAERPQPPQPRYQPVRDDGESTANG